MSNLSTFLSTLGFKSAAKGEWEAAECPWCGGKKTLRFNAIKVIGVCYRCPKTVFLRDLAKLAGISTGELKKYVEDAAADERKQMGFAEAMLDGLLGQDRPRELPTVHAVLLPEEFRTLEDGQNSVLGAKALAYMLGRGFQKSILFEMGFGYCGTGEYEGRVIIPFYENEELVYWQARDFTGHVDPSNKIKNPRADMTEHGKSDVLFNYDGVRQLPTIVMTESWGSALAVGRSAFALNGKSMSEVQEHKVRGLSAHTVLVLLDAGTTKMSWDIAKRLAPYKQTWVCTLKSGDPADVSRSVLLDTVSNARQYSGDEHIRALAEGTWNA